MVLIVHKDLHTHRQAINISDTSLPSAQNSHFFNFFGSWSCEQVEMRLLPKYEGGWQLITKYEIINNCLRTYASVSTLNLFLIPHWMNTMLLAFEIFVIWRGSFRLQCSYLFFLLLELFLSFRFLTMLDYALEASGATNSFQQTKSSWKLQAVELPSKIQTRHVIAIDRAHQLKWSSWPPCIAASLSVNRAVLPCLYILRTAHLFVSPSI